MSHFTPEQGLCAWDLDYNRSPSPYPGALSPGGGGAAYSYHSQSHVQPNYNQNQSCPGFGHYSGESGTGFGQPQYFNCSTTTTKSTTFHTFPENVLQPSYDAQFVYPESWKDSRENAGAGASTPVTIPVQVKQQQFQGFQQQQQSFQFQENQEATVSYSQQYVEDDADAQRLSEFQAGIYHLQDEREQMQVRTFTKWINSHLAKLSSSMRIKSVLEDFQDGVKLLALLQILSGQRFRVEKGKRRHHHLCNFDTALEFLEERRKIKLVNINTFDLVDGRPSVVLGLVWAIILHFQIEGSGSAEGTPPPKPPTNEGPRNALLEWVRGLFLQNGVAQQVNNFSGSWRDGCAFLHLVNCISRRKKRLVNVESYGNRSIQERLETAFRLAEEKWGIPCILEARDVECQPDDKSIMTYVAQFCSKYNSFSQAEDADDEEEDVPLEVDDSQEKLELERLELEKLALEKLELEEQQELERLELEKRELERLEQERLELERQRELDRQELERQELERLQREQMELENLRKLEQEKLENLRKLQKEHLDRYRQLLQDAEKWLDSASFQLSQLKATPFTPALLNEVEDFLEKLNNYRPRLQELAEAGEALIQVTPELGDQVMREIGSVADKYNSLFQEGNELKQLFLASQAEKDAKIAEDLMALNREKDNICLFIRNAAAALEEIKNRPIPLNPNVFLQERGELEEIQQELRQGLLKIEELRAKEMELEAQGIACGGPVGLNEIGGQLGRLDKEAEGIKQKRGDWNDQVTEFNDALQCATEWLDKFSSKLKGLSKVTPKEVQELLGELDGNGLPLLVAVKVAAEKIISVLNPGDRATVQGATEQLERRFADLKLKLDNELEAVNCRQKNWQDFLDDLNNLLDGAMRNKLEKIGEFLTQKIGFEVPPAEKALAEVEKTGKKDLELQKLELSALEAKLEAFQDVAIQDPSRFNDAKAKLNQFSKGIQSFADKLNSYTDNLRKEKIPSRQEFHENALKIKSHIAKVSADIKDSLFPLEGVPIQEKIKALSLLEAKGKELATTVLPRLKNQASSFLERDCDEDQAFSLKQLLAELDLEKILQWLKDYSEQLDKKTVPSRLSYKDNFAKCLKGLQSIDGAIPPERSPQNDPAAEKIQLEKELDICKKLLDDCGQLNGGILQLISNCSSDILPNLLKEDQPILQDKLKSLGDYLSEIEGKLNDKMKGLIEAIKNADNLVAVADEARKFLNSLTDNMAALKRPVGTDFTPDSHISAYEKLLEKLRAYRKALQDEPRLKGLSTNPDLIAMTTELDTLEGILEGEIAKLRKLLLLKQEYLKFAMELGSLILLYSDVVKNIERGGDGGDLQSKIKALEDTLPKLAACGDLLIKVTDLGKALAAEDELISEAERKAITEQQLPSLAGQLDNLQKAVKDKLAEYKSLLDKLKKLSEEVQEAVLRLREQEPELKSLPPLGKSLEEALKKEETFSGFVGGYLTKLGEICNKIKHEDSDYLPQVLKESSSEAKLLLEDFPQELQVRRNFLLEQKRIREAYQKEKLPIEQWIGETTAKLGEAAGPNGLLDLDSLDSYAHLYNPILEQNFKISMQQRLISLRDVARQVAPLEEQDAFVKEHEFLNESTQNVFNSAANILSRLGEVKNQFKLFLGAMESANLVISQILPIYEEVPPTNLPALHRNLTAVKNAEALLLKAKDKTLNELINGSKSLQKLNISQGSLDKIQKQINEMNLKWEQTSKQLESKRNTLQRLGGKWEQYEQLCGSLEAGLTTGEVSLFKVEPLIKSEEQVDEKITILTKILTDTKAVEAAHQQLLQNFPNWVSNSQRDIQPNLLNSRVDQVCVNLLKFLGELDDNLKCLNSQRSFLSEVNSKVTESQQFLQNIRKDITGLDPFSREIIPQIPQIIGDIHSKLQRATGEISALDSNVKEKFSGWEQLSPTLIARTVSNLGLELERTLLAFEDKGKAVNEAKILLAAFDRDMESLKGWVKTVESQLQHQATQQPSDQRDALQMLSSEVPGVLYILERANETGNIIAKKKKMPGAMEDLQFLGEMSQNILGLKGSIEERKVKVEECLQSWQRFMEMYQQVMEWARKGAQFLKEPFSPASLEETRQKLGNYALASKTVEGITGKLSDMGKETEKVVEICSASPLYQKLDEAEQAKTDVEGRLVERTSLLHETVDEWEQFNLKLKEVDNWLGEAKILLETAQMSSVGKLKTIREKLLADVRVQKTKIGMAIQKLQIHFKAIAGGNQSVQEEQKKLDKQLDSFEDNLKAMDFTSPR